MFAHFLCLSKSLNLMLLLLSLTKTLNLFNEIHNVVVRVKYEFVLCFKGRPYPVMDGRQIHFCVPFLEAFVQKVTRQTRSQTLLQWGHHLTRKGQQRPSDHGVEI